MTTGDDSQRYQLLERIAVGGMAEVFRAKSHGSHGFEKTLAIKRILPGLARDPEFEQRFIAEAKMAVTLSHANIVQVLDFSRFGESLYIVMEFVDGVDLAALLETERTRDSLIPLDAGLHIATEMLKGLQFAHGRGIVHRDISPSNLLLSRAGEVKLADFGIAQAIGSGSPQTRVMGKWRYMSPEQARGRALDQRSDLFSAASLLFELFTGRRLFPGDSAEAIVANIEHMPIPRASDLRPQLPAGIDEILARALTREVDDRADSAEELMDALVDVSYASAVKATATSVRALVAAALGPSVGERDAPADASHLIDDIINSELAGGRTPSRVTAVGGPPPLFVDDDYESATSGSSATTSERTSTTGRTLVRRGRGPDGLTQWELAADSVAPDATEPASEDHRMAASRGSAGRLADGGFAPGDRSDASAVGQDDTASTSSEDIRPSDDVRPSDPARIAVAPTPAASRWRWLVPLAALLLVGVWLLQTTLRPGSTPESPRASLASDPAAGSSEPTAPISTVADRPAGEPANRAGTVHITSIPEGAAVSVNGAPWPELTPTTLSVAPSTTAGSYTVRVTRAGYRPCVREALQVEAGAATRITCRLQPLTTTLEVTSKPTGAQVSLDGRVLGVTPSEPWSVIAYGRGHTLRIRRDGYREVTMPILLLGDRPVTVHKALEARVRYSTVDSYSEPWADIYFQGRKIATAPQRGVRLPHGRHQLTLVNPVQDLRGTLTVTVPAKKPYRLRLDKAH